MSFTVRVPLTRLFGKLKTSKLNVLTIQNFQARTILSPVQKGEAASYHKRGMCSLTNDLEDGLVQNIEKFGLENFSHKYDRELLKEVCSKFLSVGVNREDLIYAFCRPAPNGEYSDPPIFTMNTSKLQRLLDVFVNHGIKPGAIIRVMHYCGDDIKSITPNGLDDVLMKLASLSYLETSITKFLDVCPQLIFFDAKMDETLKRLRSIFPKKELMHLLRNAPNVLTDPWNVTTDKLNYIDQEMGLDQPHIAYNKTMSYSLQHIRDRHVALVRAGMYKRPKLNRDRLSHLMNEKLEIIMESSDAQFCKRILQIPLEDYECFIQLLHREQQEDITDVPLDDYESDKDEILEQEARRKSYGPRPKRTLSKMPNKDYQRWLQKL